MIETAWKIKYDKNILKKEDIRENVEEPATMVSTMVIVPKRVDSIRIIVDKKVPNRAIQKDRDPISTLEEINKRNISFFETRLTVRKSLVRSWWEFKGSNHIFNLHWSAKAEGTNFR